MSATAILDAPDTAASPTDLVAPDIHRGAPQTAPNAPALAPSTKPQGKTFEIDCTLSYSVTGPTDFLFMVHAVDGMDQQVLSESLVLTPGLPAHVYADPSVHHRFVRVHVDTACAFELNYRARVRRTPLPVDPTAAEVPIAELPDDILHNLMPTRYCESDHLFRAATKLFGQTAPGYPRVQAIVDWIHANIDYRLGSSDSTTTARDVFMQHAGVCRDFAHLAVTFCRALNIPARLVVGYARFDAPPPDFHAVFEAYLGGRWVLFDATRMSPLDDLVRIATGRDAKDVAFATIFGPAQMIAMEPLIRRVD